MPILSLSIPLTGVGVARRRAMFQRGASMKWGGCGSDTNPLELRKTDIPRNTYCPPQIVRSGDPSNHTLTLVHSVHCRSRFLYRARCVGILLPKGMTRGVCSQCSFRTIITYFGSTKGRGGGPYDGGIQSKLGTELPLHVPQAHVCHTSINLLCLYIHALHPPASADQPVPRRCVCGTFDTTGEHQRH